MITHKHHIIPKHAGGTDDPSNLVELTVEDHAIAHWVRYMIYGDPRDKLAAHMIRGQIDRAEAIKELQRLPKTEQHKRKIGDAVRGEKNGMYGKKQSQKQRDAVSKALKGKKKWYKVVVPKTVLCGADNGMSKAVIAEGVEYPTLTAAAKALGVSRGTVANRLRDGLFKYK